MFQTTVRYTNTKTKVDRFERYQAGGVFQRLVGQSLAVLQSEILQRLIPHRQMTNALIANMPTAT